MTADFQPPQHAPAPATAIPGFAVSGICALVMALSTLMVWARIWVVTLTGLDADRGVICGVAGLAGIALCLGRGFKNLSDGWYFNLGLVLAALGALMSGWFLIDVSNEGSSELFGEEIQLVQVGDGPYIAFIASVAYGISLFVQRNRLKRSAPSVEPASGS